jgi:hypothetical protein
MPAHWFTDSFAADQQAEFAHRYAEQFAEFKRSTATSFSDIDALKQRVGLDPGTPVDIHTRPWTPAESKRPQPVPALRVPLPPIEKFEIDDVLGAPGQRYRRTMWVESFVYVDGAFRFFGRGSNAFWTPIPPARQIYLPSLRP